MLGFKNISRLWRRWKDSRDASVAFDSLLVVPSPDADLADRNRWLVEVAYWVRQPIKDESRLILRPLKRRLLAMI